MKQSWSFASQVLLLLLVAFVLLEVRKDSLLDPHILTSASIHSPGGPVDQIVNRFQVFPDLPGPLKVSLGEGHAVTNVSLSDPFLITQWTLPRNGPDVPYRFLPVWGKMFRNDKSLRARTLYSGYRNGRTFLSANVYSRLTYQITVPGRKRTFLRTVRYNEWPKRYRSAPLGVVPEAGGRHRLTLDLRWVNESISTPSLEQSELTELRHIVGPGDQFTKLDLENGFWDVSVAESSLKYLGFRWMGKYYQWCALPFGLACSQCYFAKLVHASVQFLALSIP